MIEHEWTPALRAVVNTLDDLTEGGDINLSAVPREVLAHHIAEAVRAVVLREVVDSVVVTFGGGGGGTNGET